MDTEPYLMHISKHRFYSSLDTFYRLEKQTVAQENVYVIV